VLLCRSCHEHVHATDEKIVGPNQPVAGLLDILVHELADVYRGSAPKDTP
jgi:hypothetical protein